MATVASTTTAAARNTRTSAAAKLNRPSSPTAPAFATTGETAACSTSTAVTAMLPKIDVTPVRALNRASRDRRSKRLPAGRSRHVQRSCQAKLQRIAASTAIAVARA